MKRTTFMNVVGITPTEDGENFNEQLGIAVTLAEKDNYEVTNIVPYVTPDGKLNALLVLRYNDIMIDDSKSSKG